jgi:hypothetical protein
VPECAYILTQALSVTNGIAKCNGMLTASEEVTSKKPVELGYLGQRVDDLMEMEIMWLKLTEPSKISHKSSSEEISIVKARNR